MLRLKGCLLAACLLSPLTQAADLGTWGDLWPVREQDMLQLITQRLQSLQSSGQWDQTMDAFKQRVIENSQRPAPVEGIKRAEKYEQRWFDPSIRLTEDLKDNEGRVFARKGDVVNPLKTVPFVQTLYFINGDDADQLARFVHRHRSRDAAVGAFRGAVVKPLQRVGAHRHVAFNDAKSRFGLQRFAACRLQHQQIVGRRMVGEVREVDEAEPHLF